MRQNTSIAKVVNANRQKVLALIDEMAKDGELVQTKVKGNRTIYKLPDRA